MSRFYGNILDRIGGTPLVPITRLNPNKDVQILAKLEMFNPGGSVKDRPALSMIEDAEQSGLMTQEKIILEATSGNTGIGLALVAAVKGYRILLSMSEAVSEERVKILKAMGADIHFTPARMSTDGAIEFVYSLSREHPDKYWLADQFNNPSNWMAHYRGTGPEILEQTGGRLDAVVASMGTTGTVMGLSRFFKEKMPSVLVVGIEPFMGHKIQGLKNMKESYPPGIYQRSRLDRVINIDDEEAYETSRLLARREGLFVGMSSGAAMAGALRLASEMRSGRIVVILPDGGERYLSTPLFTVKKSTGLRLFNTLSRKKEDFLPIKENKVSIYTCGPTLCHDLELGQCRRFVVADLLRRYLEYKGFEVRHITNVTDLDDRTIQGADEAGMPLKEFTERYYNAFMEDLEVLRVKKASAYPKASEHVEEMIAMSEKLMEKGFAYEKFRSIYFDISRLKDYGRLSRLDLDKIKVGKTVDLDQYEKGNPKDFTLLKRSTLAELKKGLFYQTKWGNLRPSWHIECSAMAMKHMGPLYDIHTSGVELIFPHHENAVAISQALTGRPPANYWLHNEPVLVNGKKCKPTEGKAVPTLRQLLGLGYTGRVVRYWLLSRHYRKPLFYSPDRLDAARNTLERLDSMVDKLHLPTGKKHNPELDQICYDMRQIFTDALDDDLNISSALAALFKALAGLNAVMDKKGITQSDAEKVLETLARINSVLGVMDLTSHSLPDEVKTLAAEREEARRKKDWAAADAIRARLMEMGYEILDTKAGPSIRSIR
jgi:cysteinyl-tRNA synthetase